MKTLQIQVPENKEIVVKLLLKELGVTFKAVKLAALTDEEKHTISALKQADLLKHDNLPTVDAKNFLNALG